MGVILDDIDLQAHDGWPDKGAAWDIVKDHGITREDFLKQFPLYAQTMHEFLIEKAKHQQLYEAIPDAKQFVDILSKDSLVAMGVLTGNVERIAHWKLENTGMAKYFSFGLYGDEADTRVELAGKVFEKAKAHFHQAFAPSDIVVIGDTINDIRCGKAIGAMTVGVTTGMHGPRDVLEAEHPDLVVDTLLDTRVLDLFHLS